MLAVTDIDVFVLMNGLMQRYPKNKQPKVFYGINSYMSTPPAQRGHALVMDATAMFAGVEPKVELLVEDAVIDWNRLDAYLDTNPRKLPLYTFKRPNVIEDMLPKLAANDKHALSAMLSNFTPASRPAVKSKVIEFLTNPKVKNFSLPLDMQPKRGRAVEYYQAAIAADHSEIKADILLERPSSYEARYWAKVIAKEQKKGDSS